MSKKEKSYIQGFHFWSLNRNINVNIKRAGEGGGEESEHNIKTEKKILLR